MLMTFDDVEFRHLRALRAVAEEGSFVGAADILGFSQAAISQQIAGLEKAVGVALFDRPGGPRPVTLTPAGRVLLRHADAVVELLDKYQMVWGCMARADYLRKKIDDWADMRKKNGRKVAGFGGAAIGIETLHQERLDDIKKKDGTEDILETLRMLQARGLGTVGYYMIGFEEDTKESLKEDIKKLAALKLESAR